MRKFRVVLIALACVTAAVASVYLWMNYDGRLKQTLSSSYPARLWRCRDVVRPRLSESRVPWKLKYSWSGGMGPGEMSVTIESDGIATTSAYSRLEHSARGRVSPLTSKQTATIAKVVDDTGLLCLDSQIRDGYTVFDLGRFSIDISQGSYSKTVYVDECHTVVDGRAFEAVVESVKALKPRVGDEVEWGPSGTASVARSCPSN
jgi:hypothetical protein